MKTKFISLLSILFLVPLMAQAQTSFYSDSSEVDICDTSYYLNIAPNSADWSGFNYGHFVISGTNVLNSNFDLDVIWGDGDTTNHTGTAVSNGTAINWNNPLSHLYSVGGNYTITLILNDLTNSVTYTSILDIVMGACPQYIYSTGQLDCDNDGVIDGTIAGQVPITITGGGNTYTGWQATSFTVFYGVPVDTYQVVVDSAWLAAHNYLIGSITPSSFTTSMYSGSYTIQITLICDSTLFVNNCLDGVVFCDDNNNGILDSLELPAGGAPLTLFLPDGTSHTTQSDPNGLYSFAYTGYASGGYIQVDQNWLNTNSYFNSNMFVDTISDLTCTNNPTMNIPIICDTNALSVGCIDGYVYCDDNNNGVLDSNETVFYNVPVTLNGNGGSIITVYTDSSGYYSYTGWQLSGATVLVSIDQTWQINNSAFLTGNGIVISNLNCGTGNQSDIGLNCNTTAPCADLWSSVTPWNGYYQNFTNSVWLKYGNYGTLAPGNYTLTLDFPTGVTPVVTSINNSNYTITGNTITWTLNSAATYMYFSDVIYFNTPSGIPDSTFHIFSTTISSATTDCDSTNNYSTLGMYVGNSYDPNDKSVNKPLIVNPDVQDEYTYVVRFQNTGTAPAQDVFIVDTLSANLDLSTLQILEFTHPMQLIDLGNGVMKFDFPQIWLPDSTTNEPASHGQVVYRIKELASVGEGDVIENTAYIYFDQNPAIITNTTKNINTVGLGINAVGNVDFTVFPNPAKSEITIKADGVIQTIRIIDLSGKLVFESNANSNFEFINIDALSSGLYSIEVISSNGMGRTLFVKE